MMQENIIITRLQRFAENLKEKKFGPSVPLTASYTVDEINPIPYSTLGQRVFTPIEKGEIWGKLWACAWFKFTGKIPGDWSAAQAYLDVDGEACLFKDGVPYLGLTSKVDWDHKTGKYLVPLTWLKPGDTVDLLMEAGANGLFGAQKQEFRLIEASLRVVDEKLLRLEYDFGVLLSLVQGLPEKSVRRRRIINGLNEICNAFASGVDECLAISAALLAAPAVPSALTAYSVGHAHIDLAWLWPLRETRRKGGRTFATALRNIEKYPDYIFGASQPQLYQWIKDDYPDLYRQIKDAHQRGRWECQGVSWVECDTNLIGGESLIRQLHYGKKFFREEFGVEPEYMFLPDCFGFSAALPQILARSGVKWFTTQKMSWNETNVFPHHTFIWHGLDKTALPVHFLPTNDYNLANTPQQLIASEERYAQADICSSFLNLYGIGDGGGGPGEPHIEYALRQKNLEGVPRIKMAAAKDFFADMTPEVLAKLPHYSGELYLELHRGTYTTQARTKRNNREMENVLHDLEFLAAFYHANIQNELDELWRDTLLLQFHDILPGSSIGWVYKDAEAIHSKNLSRAETIVAEIMAKNLPVTDADSDLFVVLNTLGYQREEIIQQPGYLPQKVQLPPFGYSCLKLDKGSVAAMAGPVMENDFLRATFDEQGRVSSLYDKRHKREALRGPANNILLWEDLPNNWGAWDVNHFYRQTNPQSAILQSVEYCGNTRVQKLAVGNSVIEQEICLQDDCLVFKNRVNWQEKHKMLRVQAEPDISANTALCEIQFGAIDRPTTANNSWEAARFEVCAHKYVVLQQPDYAFAVLNDCKYGHCIQGGIVDINLLRSPADVDPEADLGWHEFSFAYYPHTPDVDRLSKKAQSFNTPARVIRVNHWPEVNSACLININTEGVKVETIKPAHSGAGIIVRLYETRGGCGRAVFPEECTILHECDLLENVEKQLDGKELTFKPFEIKTVLWQNGNTSC